MNDNPGLSRRSMLALGALAMVRTGRASALFDDPPQAGAEPVVEDGWVRPAQQPGADPVWGLANGIRIGLWPTPGPRGLIRVFAPYLGQPRHRVINFIAIEPVANGRRGLSELELSQTDGKPGKMIVASDDRRDFAVPPASVVPPQGRVVEYQKSMPPELEVFFAVEPFENGARPIVSAAFARERPYEVEFRLYSQTGGAAMSACVLTATMGNYQRLRRIWLKDEMLEARAIFPDFRPDKYGFAPHVSWPIDALKRIDQYALIGASSDEDDPASALYHPDVAPGWHYVGKPASQYWKAWASERLVARVNARETYWASKAKIPNGLAIENFEMEAPFHENQTFTFGVDPHGPDDLGWKKL